MANFIPKIIYPSGGGTTITCTVPAADDPFNEEIKSYGRQSVSGSGIVQYSQDYIEETRKVKLTFLTATTIGELRTFFENHGSLKKSFDYYESADEAAYNTYTLVDDTWKIARLPGGAPFLYELTFSMRRVK